MHTTQTSNSDTWTTYTDYDPDINTTHWCLGLPGLVATTNTNPDSTSATRKLRHVWNSDCTLDYSVDESESSSAKRLKTSFTYDSFGNPDVVTTNNADSNGQERQVDYDYDVWGQFVTKQTVGTVNLYTTTSWDYVNGQPIAVTGVDGLTDYYSYDAFGRLASVTRPGTDTAYDYAACTSCFPGDAVYYVRAAHTDGSDDYEYFDALNRSVGTAWTLPGGSQGRQESEYNALGQVARVSQPYVAGESRFWVNYDYDLIGRTKAVDAPVSESQTSGATTTYDYEGYEIETTDANSRLSKTLHNALGQIVGVTDGASSTASYGYEPFGELGWMTDAGGNTTTIGYDARGFKESMNDPNMGSWSYAYNLYGELASQTNALSQTTMLEYDAAGRLEERDEPEGVTKWFYNAYDYAVGGRAKLDEIEVWDDTETNLLYREAYGYHTYFGLPTLVQRSFDGEDYFFNMSYDSHGRLDVLTYPVTTSTYRFRVDYDYDSYGQLEEVKDGNESYSYYTLNATDALGRERSASLGNGRTETRDYDEAAGYLKSIATSGSVQSLAFTYDEVGNVLTRSDSLISETETFTYDNVNRLKTSQVSGQPGVTLGYHDDGRIDSKTGIGTYSYGDSSHPHAVTSADGVAYTYDANGRMITRGSDEIDWYSYDKPKSIEHDIGTQLNTSEFWYGADRARYKQVIRVDGAVQSTIHYVGTLFEFEDAATDTYRHYVPAGDRVVAMVERVGTTNTKHFLHRDNQGSVTKVTNSGGTVVQAMAFDAWGLRRDPTDWSSLGSPFAGSHETERGYTGHEHLDNVGLIHMNGRVQDPILGRFISPDPFMQAPFSTQSQNRYSYVWNNPASMIDPSGFFCFKLLWVIPIGGDCGSSEGDDWMQGGIEDEQWEKMQDYFAEMREEANSSNQLPCSICRSASVPNGGSGLAMGSQIHPMTPRSGEANVRPDTRTWRFSDNFAGRTLEQTDFFLGWLASPFIEGETRGLVSGNVPTPGQLRDARQDGVLTILTGSTSRLVQGSSEAVLAGKSLGANPFKGKTAEGIADMLSTRGYLPRGPDPVAGRGTFVNPATGRGYHIDASHPLPKGPHVGVHRPRSLRDVLPPRDYPTGGQ